MHLTAQKSSRKWTWLWLWGSEQTLPAHPR